MFKSITFMSFLVSVNAFAASAVVCSSSVEQLNYELNKGTVTVRSHDGSHTHDTFQLKVRTVSSPFMDGDTFSRRVCVTVTGEKLDD